MYARKGWVVGVIEGIDDSSLGVDIKDPLVGGWVGRIVAQGIEDPNMVVGVVTMNIRDL